jgi:hypothetical protein
VLPIVLWSERRLPTCVLVLALPLVGQVSVLTHHGDNARTGANLNESALQVGKINNQNFGKLAYRLVDGNVYAQPLIVSQAHAVNHANPANLAIVATEHNSVYAFDAEDTNQNSTTAKVWQSGPDVLGTSLDSYAFYRDLGIAQCVDITLEIGITSTPAIQITKPASGATGAEGVVFLTAKSKAGAAYQYNLFALSLADGSKMGSTAIGGQVSGHGIGSTGSGANAKITFDPKLQLNRPGLLLVGNTLYVAFGGHCDKGNYHGWLFAYDVSNPKALKRTGILCTSPNGTGPLFDNQVVEGEAGVWMSGEGPAVDAAGDVYFVTGNGTNNKTTDLGDSVVKVSLGSGGFTVKDWFTPQNETQLKNFDLDLGSAGTVLIPDSHLLVAGGKEGRMYLLDRNNLGKGTAASLQSFQVTHALALPISYNIHGTPVIWQRTNEVYVYVTGEEDPVRQFRLVPDTTPAGAGWKFDPPGPYKTSSASAPYSGFPGGEFGRPNRDRVWMPGGFMTVSAMGSADGSGILWVTMPFAGNANAGVVRGVMRAFNASDVSQPELWDSEGTGNNNDRLGQFAKFNPPTVANGKVYVGTFQEEIVSANQTHSKNPQGDQPALVIYGLR